MNKFINSFRSNNINRRDFLKFSAASLLTASLAGLGINYATNIEPADVEVKNIYLKLHRLDRAFNGFRLAQVSDLHLDNWMTPERLKSIFQLVLAQKPDAVAITGDFITYHDHTKGLKNPYLTDLASALNTLSPHQPTLGVLGNHDHEIGAPLIHDALVAGHVTDLSNSMLTFHQSGSSLHIAGVDQYPLRIYDYDPLLNNIPTTGAAIMLDHILQRLPVRRVPVHGVADDVQCPCRASPLRDQRRKHTDENVTSLPGHDTAQIDKAGRRCRVFSLFNYSRNGNTVIRRGITGIARDAARIRSHRLPVHRALLQFPG